MQKTNLSNDIVLVTKKMSNTPRVGLCFTFRLNKPENKTGVYNLINRLFLQGTKNRSAEELAQELDENAIECYCEYKYDFFKFKLTCLNEDFALGLEILADIIKNSTFKELEKEKVKFKGELYAEMDSPRAKAFDKFYQTIYKGHIYGTTCSLLLDSLDDITSDDIQSGYREILDNTYKAISVVGDVEQKEAKDLCEKYFADILNSSNFDSEIGKVNLEDKKFVTVEKSDAAQAQIIMGWVTPACYTKDYFTNIILSSILGSSGLSSRLFVELREKKGLAYHVRSSCDSHREGGAFYVYIATTPKNINIALDGFKTEIDKLKNELVGEKELEDAKNNIIGKQHFFTETNSQKANYYSTYEAEKLGYDYNDKMIEAIKAVTREDIQEFANKYLNDKFVLSILAPKNNLDEVVI